MLLFNFGLLTKATHCWRVILGNCDTLWDTVAGLQSAPPIARSLHLCSLSQPSEMPLDFQKCHQETNMAADLGTRRQKLVSAALLFITKVPLLTSARRQTLCSLKWFFSAGLKSKWSELSIKNSSVIFKPTDVWYFIHFWRFSTNPKLQVLL